jgi:hypothetical protein
MDEYQHRLALLEQLVEAGLIECVPYREGG